MTKRGYVLTVLSLETIKIMISGWKRMYWLKLRLGRNVLWKCMRWWSLTNYVKLIRIKLRSNIPSLRRKAMNWSSWYLLSSRNLRLLSKFRSNKLNKFCLRTCLTLRIISKLLKMFLRGCLMMQIAGWRTLNFN